MIMKNVFLAANRSVFRIWGRVSALYLFLLTITFLVSSLQAGQGCADTLPYNHSNPQSETRNLSREPFGYPIGYPRFGKEMGDQGTQRHGVSGKVYERKVSDLQGSCDITLDWQIEIKGSYRNGARSVQQTTDGGYIMTGYKDGTSGFEVYLHKTNASGNLQWQRTFGKKAYNTGYSAQQTADGGYIIVGLTADNAAIWDSFTADIYLIKTDALGNKQWEKTFGGKTKIYVKEMCDIGHSVRQTTDGGYIIAGDTNTTEDDTGFGYVYDAVFLIKTDALGNKEWEKTFGGAETKTWDMGRSVQQTKDGGYIIAGSKNSGYAEGKGTWDVYLIKTDNLGNKQWEKTYGGTDHELGMSCQQTTDGGYIITGFVLLSEGYRPKVYLVKTDASGTELWEKTFAGEGNAIGSSVQQTKDGGYIIGGGTGVGFYANAYLIKTDAEGNAQWENTFAGGNTGGYSSPSSAKQTTDGGYIIAGAYDFYNILLVKRIADDICTDTDKNLGQPRDEHTSQGGQVNVANGNMYIIRTDSSTPFRDVFPFEFTRSYNSYYKQNGPFGFGWTHNFNVKIYPPIDGESPAIIHDIDGRLISFKQDIDGNFQPVGDEHSTLHGREPSYYWGKKNGMTYEFGSPGLNEYILYSIEDKNGNEVSCHWERTNGIMRLTGLHDNGNSYYGVSYDNRDHITRIEDSAKRVFAYEYDDKDNLIKVTDPAGVVTVYEYNDPNDPHNITKQTVDTFVYTYSYDDRGRCIKAVGSNGEAGYSFEYKSNEGKTVITDSRGNVLTKYYNPGGKVTKIVYPNGSEENFTWDENMNKIAEMLQNGSTWSYEYDGNGNRTKIINPQGGQKVMTYNEDNNLTSIVGELGNTTRYDYDSRGNLTKVTSPDGTVSTFTYNTRGQPLTYTDSLGKTTTATYDDYYGTIDSVTDPQGNTITYIHDFLLGRVTSMTDARGNTTSYEYDALDRVIKIKDTLNGLINTTHKTAGLGSLTDQNGNTSSFQYDALNLLTDVIDPLGKTKHLSYDTMGNQASRTDFNKAVTGYTYNVMNNLTKIQYPGDNRVALAYNTGGKLTQMNDYTGTTSYDYNAMGRMIAHTNGQELSVYYAYDYAGNLAALTYPGGKTVHYSYDSQGRLIQVEDWAGRKTTYSYDQRGLVVDITLPNGTKTHYDYDDAGRMIGLKNLKSDDSVIASYTYTLDRNGNIIAETVDQPLSPVMQSLSSNYSYGQDNRLVSVNDVSLTYDLNGNLVKKGDITYEYDYENRIKKVVNTNGTWEYEYDGLGNRVGLKAGGETRRFLLGTRGMTHTLAEHEGDGNLIAYYIYGLGLVYKVDVSDKPYYYYYNFTGSTVAMTDTDGNIVNKYAYTPFGGLAGSVEAVSNPFRYVGRFGVMDDNNGLYYMRARYYDPDVGRFITKDPIGFGGGVNLYGYVGGNPINFIDPSGLANVIDAIWEFINSFVTPHVPGTDALPLIDPKLHKDAYTIVDKSAENGITRMGNDGKITLQEEEQLKELLYKKDYIGLRKKWNEIRKAHGLPPEPENRTILSPFIHYNGVLK